MSHIEAIDLVGEWMFGTDWVGNGLSGADQKILEKYGPQPSARGGTTIAQCPPSMMGQRDRIISRAQRVLPQRGAAIDWLMDRGLVTFDGGNRDAIIANMKGKPGAASSRGAPRKIEAVAVAIRMDLASGQITRDALLTRGKILEDRYKISGKTFREARKLALGD